MARLLNLACFILQRSQVFSRLDIEKDLSADALVSCVNVQLANSYHFAYETKFSRLEICNSLQDVVEA